MFGVLVDVSVSMKKAVTANYDIRSGLTDENVKRFHRIVTSLNKIVTDIVTTYDRKDLIFVSAFGLNASKCEGTDTCDFVSTLENVTRLQEINERRTTSEKQYLHDGHKILIEFAKRKNAPHAEPWIKDKLWPREAGILWEALKDDDLLAEKFLGLIPHESLGTHSFVIRSLLLFSRFYASALALQKIKNAVDSHKASTLARDTIKKTICEETELVNTLQKIQKPKPRLAKDVLSILNTILQGNKESSSSRVCKAIDSVSSYIFGETSMVTALKEAKEIFDSHADINQKVLFVFSGGVATDGNPIDIAQELKSSNVTIVTCYLTSDSIPEPEGLVDTEDPSWCKCARDLYHMSSAMPNTSIPITYLIDYGWKLPLSGESRLFVQANSLDVADKLCKVAVSQLMPNTDPLIDLLGKVSLATYIKQSNDDFQAQQQIGATCYANAIAAVFHLAMRRICNREGGIPEFETIRDRITQAFGKEAANTEAVIEKVHKEYRLEYCKVDEKGARQAINERRPVIARFSWKGNQEEMFKRFYKRFPTEILKASDIAVEGITM